MCRQSWCAIVLFSASVTSAHLYFQTARHSLCKTIFCFPKEDLQVCINKRDTEEGEATTGREKGNETEAEKFR